MNTSTTPKLQYGYASVADGSRLTLMTYPNGRQLEYSYGSTNSLNDRIGRLTSIIGSTAMLESY